MLAGHRSSEPGSRRAIIHAVIETQIEEIDQRWRRSIEKTRQSRGVLSEIRRPETVAEKSPYFPGRRAVVVPVNRDGEVNLRIRDEL